MQNLCTFGKITFNFSKIGVIGLGNMGLPMALNLKKNGHEVFGQDVDISKAKFALQNDIVFVNRVKDLAKMVDTFVVMVPDTENSESVCNGDAGIFKNGMEGALIIDSSTISPAVSQNLSAKAKNWNMTYVDAPVTGGVMGANNATLTFLVGSDSEADYLRARPIIETMGEKIFWIKRAGGGQIVKMCSNIAVAAQMVGVCEALAVGSKMGINPRELSDILSITSSHSHSIQANNPIPGYLFDTPSSRQYEKGFASELTLKNMNLAVQTASTVGINAPLSKKSKDVYGEVVKKGYGEKDFSIVYDLLQKKEL